MTPESLNSAEIMAAIESRHLPHLSKLEIFDTLESTNTYLLSHAKSSVCGWVCFAEQQTAGRGRLGRQWFSPRGKNIYCSILWHFPLELDVSGLGIAVSVMVAEALKRYGASAGIQLKWPNDVLFAGRKLAGILLERRGHAVVIGIGVNLDLSGQEQKNWIALNEIMQDQIRRNHFAGLLVNTLLEKLPLYPIQGLAAFLGEWRHYDFLIGKHIALHQGEKQLTGIMQGINSAGELLLENAEGKLQCFRYGEVSARVIV